MKNNFTHLYLLSISFVVCWAVPTSFNEAKAKAYCPSSLQNDAAVPCWILGVNSKCYCFSTTKRLDWRGANDFCRGGGMTLLGIETYEEDMLISNHIKSISMPELLDDYYWTSGRYSQEGNKRWEWATVEPFQPMTYTNWYPGLPNNNAPGSFAYVNYLFDRGTWFDMANTTSILFTCESIDGSTTTTSPTVSSTTTESTTTEKTTTESTTTEGTTTAERTTTESTTTESTTTESTTTDSTTTESTTTESTTTERTTTDSTTTDSTTTESTTTESTTTEGTTTVLAAIALSSFTCPAPNGNFEIPGNCTSYYNCTNGEFTIQNCPPGLAFNPDVGVCDYPFNVPGCSVIEVTETENSRLLNVDRSFRCPGNGNWPHPVHCHFFYTCYNHRADPAQLWQCEENFLYDVRRRQCRYSKNTVCGNRLQPKKH